MKQALAIRVGAKKAVGHIVSKRWWPTSSDDARDSGMDFLSLTHSFSEH